VSPVPTTGTGDPQTPAWKPLLYTCISTDYTQTQPRLWPNLIQHEATTQCVLVYTLMLT